MGDKRLTRRLIKIGNQLSRNGDNSLSKSCRRRKVINGKE
ncbi:MAG: hypothetical protein HYX60_08405 [Legionella longbeachae]|nr:hypothetical protein [Legionella longbeachae]